VDSKPETILVEWFGTKKNGKVALLSKQGGVDKWFNIGKNFVSSKDTFEKGKTYEVIIGEDQFHNFYINGIDEGGQGMVGLSVDTPLSTPSETAETPKERDVNKPIFSGARVIQATDDVTYRALRLACAISPDWETAKALSENSIIPYLKGKQ